MTNSFEKYWNMDYLTEKHLAGFDNYKVSHCMNVCVICVYVVFVHT